MPNSNRGIIEKGEVDHIENQSTDVLSNDKSYQTSTAEQKLFHIDSITFQNANKATTDEHEITLRESIKLYKSSIFWAIVMSSTIIMEGYDSILMGSFFAYPTFKAKYGTEISPGVFELTSKWQVALRCSASAGTILGTVSNGYLIERFGHRILAMVALTFMASFIFIPFFAQKVEHLLIGQIFCGMTWGIFSTLGPAYSSEVLNLNLRGYLSAYINLCWATGQFVAAGVLRGLIHNQTQWSYRVPFAVQWVWIPPLFIFSFLAPDSPQWLIRKGRLEAATKSLTRLSDKSIQHKVHERIAMMVRTNQLEKEQELAKGDDIRGMRGYLQCFKGTNRRRTEIACIAFAGQILAGSTFAYSPSYFFAQAGLNSSDTYKLNLGVTSIAWTGTVCSWFLLNRFGRRTIYVTGYTVLTVVLLIIGAIGTPSNQTTSLKWAQCGIVLLWVATYALSIGPLAFVVVGEMSATRLRSPTIGLARGTYSTVALVSNIVEPYLINPTSANLKGKTAYVWLATALSVLTWSYFRLPETRGRTYEELDVLFQKNVPAREFSSYNLQLAKELAEVAPDAEDVGQVTVTSAVKV